MSGNPQASNILGSWGGIRDRLELNGVSVSVSYLGQFATNPVGGRTEGGASWIGDWTVATFVDFQRMLDIDQRVYFITSTNLQTGNTGLSPNYVGNLYPVQLSSSDAPAPHPSLVHLALGAQIFDDTTEVVGGRILAGDDFAFLSQACSSLNQDICGNPLAGASSINFPTYPNASWGARLKVKPGQSWYAQAGAYLVYPDLGNPDEHGIEFGSPDGAGVLSIGETGFNVGKRAGRPGLPGTYKFGGYYDTERMTDLMSGTDRRNTWGVYAMGEQMLYSENDDYSNGLWAWLALSYAPPDVNQIEFMAAGGLTYVGPLSTRPHDAVSFVAATGVFSDSLPDQSAETVLEFNYRAQLLPVLYIQPDIQYVINPDGYSNTDNALVLGFAIGATF
ncbi:carbohydrate porin [Hoeflea sp. TYP-13]|uniref:carbohydrate porin n=1 Tax=Hoeflea sp. TYP-13 TaxID=3230023 RepID=UPI0034C6C513